MGLAIIFIGLGSVAWLLYTERKNNQPAEEPAPDLPKETPDQLLSRVGLAENFAAPEDKPQKKNPFSGLLSKFTKKEEAPDDSAAFDPEPRMRITKDILQTGTSSVRLNPVPESTPEPEPQPIPNSAYNEPNLKEKYAKVEAMLTEKTEALEKSEKALAAEIKNKKEFNKVKDLLEKEIKDDKVKYRDLQVQIGTSQMEATSSKNRVNQLEMKVTKLEKTVSDLEHELKGRDEKIFDRETKLKELTDKLAAKEKIETIKVPAEPPATPPASIPKTPEQSQLPPSEAAPAANIPAEPLPALPEPTPAAEPAPPAPAPPPPMLEAPVASEPPKTESGGEASSLKLPPDILKPEQNSLEQ